MAAATSAGSATPSEVPKTLSSEELREMHAYWRAANYLSVGQIYLLHNPLLREPLKRAHQAEAAGSLGHDAGFDFIHFISTA